MFRRRRLLALSLVLIAAAGPVRGDDFPRPSSLKPAVAFWTRVYAESDTTGGFLHDPERLDVVYEQLRLPQDRRQAQREISARTGFYATVLKRAAQGAQDADAQRVRALWGDATPGTLRAAAGRIRFQRGQSDKFRAGLVRSGAWEAYIRDTFAKRGLPLELAALPHVESSFNPRAGSHVGAAGLWQFMAGTGRRFIRVDALVDERLDVYRSTEAAAQLLEENYGYLGTWPLALTAYNHGRGGMQKAVRTLGTDDIGRIIAEYRGPAFGFASRNFYPCFLAAKELARDPEPHFGAITRDPPAPPRSVTLPGYLPVAELERELGVSRSDLAMHNPALDDSIWSGRKLLPAGYALHLPRAVKDDAPQRVAALAQRAGITAQIADRTHRVARGESLGVIARRHGTTVAALGKANQLRSPYRLRAGQTLRLPDTGGGDRVPAATQLAQAPSAPTPAVAAPATAPLPTTTARVQVVIAPPPATPLAAVHETPVVAASATPAVRTPAPAPAAVVAAASIPAPGAKTTPPRATPARGVVIEPGTQVLAASLVPRFGLPETASPARSTAAAAEEAELAVAVNGRVRVQPDENLLLYAKWTGRTPAQLRAHAGLGKRAQARAGQDLRLDVSRVQAAEVERQRRAWHAAQRTAYLARNPVTNTVAHTVRRGDSLWTLCQSRYGVPLWLVRAYNPQLGSAAQLRPGAKLTIPRVAPGA